MPRATKRRSPMSVSQLVIGQGVVAPTKGGVARLNFDGVKNFDLALHTTTKSPVLTPLCDPDPSETIEPARRRTEVATSAARSAAAVSSHTGGPAPGEGDAAAHTLLQLLSSPMLKSDESSTHRPERAAESSPPARETLKRRSPNGVSKAVNTITKQQTGRSKMVMAVPLARAQRADLPVTQPRPTNQRELMRWARVAMMAAPEV